MTDRSLDPSGPLTRFVRRDPMYVLIYKPNGWAMDFRTLEDAKESALFLTGEMWDGRMS